MSTGDIHLWDTATGAKKKTFLGHTEIVTHLLFVLMTKRCVNFLSLKIEDVCKDLEQCGLYTFRPSGVCYWLYQSGLYTIRLSEALENHISAPAVRKVYRILKNLTNILQLVTLVKWHCEQ